MIPGVQPVIGTNERDPYWDNVHLLIPANDGNGVTSGFDKSKYAYTLTAAGNAQQSTTQAKWGAGSLKFDGTGDYITGDTQFPAVGTADLTIEFWLYMTGTPAYCSICDFRGGTSDFEPYISYESAAMRVQIKNGQRMISAGGSIAQNTWYHIALSRNSTVFKAYINGVQFGSNYTDATSYGKRNLTLGAFYDQRNTGTSTKLIGHVDDFRYTSGVGRYPAAFTPPARAFPRR